MSTFQTKVQSLVLVLSDTLGMEDQSCALEVKMAILLFTTLIVRILRETYARV